MLSEFMNVQELVSTLRRIEDERIKCADQIRNMGIIKKCLSNANMNIRVGAVDASIVAQEFHSFDLIITKTAGAVFEYKDGKLKSHEYIPSSIPNEKLHTHGTMDLVELNQYRNLVRLNEEISLAQEIAEKCDIMFIDGSIVPLQSDKPSNNRLRKMYEELKGKYLKLFSKHNRKIAGIVKDSRSKRFIEEHLGKEWEQVASNSTDTTLLNLSLKKGEMTEPLTYSKDAKMNNVLKDFMPYAEDMKVTYIKAGENDWPIRVETIGYNEELMQKIYALCAINDSYSYPAILIDVDLRAMIDPKQVEQIFNDIQISPFLRDSKLLRRNRRPFR